MEFISFLIPFHLEFRISRLGLRLESIELFHGTPLFWSHDLIVIALTVYIYIHTKFSMWGGKRGVEGGVVGAKKASFTEGWVVHEKTQLDPRKSHEFERQPSTASTCNLTSYLLRDEQPQPYTHSLPFYALFNGPTNYSNRVIYSR